MPLEKLITLSDVEFETGESRHLINFLIRDREIPFRLAGMAKVLNEEGLKLLKNAIKEYRGKPTSEQRSPRRKSAAKKRKGRKDADGKTKGENFNLGSLRRKLDPVIS